MSNISFRRLAIVLAMLMILAASAVVQAAPATTSDSLVRPLDVKGRATIGFSVPGNNYEVALQKVDSSVGYVTVYVRNHESSSARHATFFYDIGPGTYRVLLSKRDGAYVNRSCEGNITIPSSRYSHLYMVDCPN